MRVVRSVKLNQERELTDVLEAAFGIIRHRGRTLFATALVFSGIFFAVALVATLWLVLDSASTNLTGDELSALFIGCMCLGFIGVVGTCNAFLKGYRSNPEAEIPPSQLLGQVLGKVPSLLLTAPIYLLLFAFSSLGVGLMLMYIMILIFGHDFSLLTDTFLGAFGVASSNANPGALLFTGLALFIPTAFFAPVSAIVVQENRNPLSALSRSFSLVAQRFWMVYFLQLTVGIMAFMMSLYLEVIIFSLADIATREVTDQVFNSDVQRTVTIAGHVVGAAYFVVAIVVVALSNSVLYFGLAEKKDGLSLYEQIETLGQTTPDPEA